jgi:hypothetical protein
LFQLAPFVFAPVCGHDGDTDNGRVPVADRACGHVLRCHCPYGRDIGAAATMTMVKLPGGKSYNIVTDYVAQGDRHHLHHHHHRTQVCGFS